MEVLLSFNARYDGVEAGVWHKVDTSTLFSNQYNLDCGVRVFDRDVRAIRDDERKGKVRCPYCGAVMMAGQRCASRPECSQFKAKSLESIFTQYSNAEIPFQTLKHEKYDLVPGKYAILRRRDESDVTYHVSTARAGATIMFLGGELYVESLGWSKVVFGSSSPFPCIPKYVVAAIRKLMKKEGLCD